MSDSPKHLLLVEDLQACRPTILPVAPRVLNKIYDKVSEAIDKTVSLYTNVMILFLPRRLTFALLYFQINNAMNAAGGVKKKLFGAAVTAKSEGLKQGQLKHGLYDRLIFNKIKKGLGMDHIRVMISGSAPLSENVMIFFRCMLGVPVVEGTRRDGTCRKQ